MNKSILISAMMLASVLCADGDLVAVTKKTNGKAQKKKNNDKAMNIVTLTSARTESNNGLYVFGDALYWHADVGNADWSERTTRTTNLDTFTVHHLDFKWNWGFKAGVGYNMDHDMWDTNLYFTWFHTENSNAVGRLDPTPSGVTSQNITTFLPPTDNVHSGKHHWSIHFGMFDWELGRWQYSSKSLALRPHVGIKSGWIHQRRRVHQSFDPLSGDRRDRGRFNNYFWGVGPSAGVNTLWVLGNAGSNKDHRFSLLGDVAGALMYGHFRNTYSNTSTSAGTTTKQKVKHLNRHLAVPMLQAMMGLSWDKACNRDRSHFTVKVGYEFQYWFRQNQFLSLKDTPTTGLLGAIRYSDDLALQGLTGEFRFDF